MKTRSVLISFDREAGFGAVTLCNGDIPCLRHTPGAVASTDEAIVMKKGYAKANRKVPHRIKRQVFAIYGIHWHERWKYDVDHVIPLSLGGSNDIDNLWPHALNAEHPPRLKMRLERKLLNMVRNGRMALREAQELMRGNWVKAFYEMCGEKDWVGGVLVSKG